VRWPFVVIPLLGIIVAAGVPLGRYAAGRQHEDVAVRLLQRVLEAQASFKEGAPGYATAVESLVTGCGDRAAALAPATLDELQQAGYALELRAAAGAATVGRDCLGRQVADDYYVALAPGSPSEPARLAFAARRDGSVFVFFDGIAPREAEMSSGLATPLHRVGSFKIP
jgi:hypothetical protein